MTIYFLCVLIAFLLNYLPKVPTAWFMNKVDSGYDNRYPRDQQAKLTGMGKRALGAHLNSFEIFPAFAAAVIIAHITGANVEILNYLSIAFVVSRIFYIAFYLLNLHLIRSTVWTIGFGIVIWIFLLGSSN
ncbi:MAG: MAPEG family protein [Leptospira sp.]|nr:MAPEG family protein [Leptospira sp.]